MQAYIDDSALRALGVWAKRPVFSVQQWRSIQTIKFIDKHTIYVCGYSDKSNDSFVDNLLAINRTDVRGISVNRSDCDDASKKYICEAKINVR